MGACQTKKQLVREGPHSSSSPSPSPTRKAKEPAKQQLMTSSSLKCTKQHPIAHICLNPSCQQNALFCSKNECSNCSVVHASCRYVEVSEVVRLIEQRSDDHDKMVANMNQNEKDIVEEIIRRKKQRKGERTDNLVKEFDLSKETTINLKGKQALEFYIKLVGSDKNLEQTEKSRISNEQKESKDKNSEPILVQQSKPTDKSVSRLQQSKKDSIIKEEKQQSSSPIKTESKVSINEQKFRERNTLPPVVYEKNNEPMMRSEMLSDSLTKVENNNYYTSMPRLHPGESNKAGSRFYQEKSSNKIGESNVRAESLEQSNIKLPNNKDLLPRIDSVLITKRDKSELYFLTKELNFPTSIALLYRASENMFDANKFHETCDNIPSTLTIIRTEFGKTIVGYTPLRWSKDQGYIEDTSNETFLLSMDEKEKMTLVNSKKAIQCLASYGPVFGGGDIAISNKCSEQPNSLTYFASSFNNDGMYQSNQNSWSTLCGVKQGNHFKVVQYEVFQVIW